MVDPLTILDDKARELYEAWRASPDSWNPFRSSSERPDWDALDNYTRELWRGEALASLRSTETLADAMKREGREVHEAPEEPLHCALCGSELDRDTSDYTLSGPRINGEDTTLYFCSQQCKEAFGD
jgi:YHS domain-containing protein